MGNASSSGAQVLQRGKLGWWENSNREKLLLEETGREAASSGDSQSGLRQREGAKPVQTVTVTDGATLQLVWW